MAVVHLTDTQLKVFDRKVLRIPPEQREVYLNQVDFLVKRLKERITDSTSFGVIKFVPAGSLPKGTILRPRDGYGVDADIGVYLDDTDATDYDLDRLHGRSCTSSLRIIPQREKHVAYRHSFTHLGRETVCYATCWSTSSCCVGSSGWGCSRIGDGNRPMRLNTSRSRKRLSGPRGRYKRRNPLLDRHKSPSALPVNKPKSTAISRLLPRHRS